MRANPPGIRRCVHGSVLRIHCSVTHFTWFAGCLSLPLLAFAAEPCRIEVVERGSDWPVPLVELRTTHSVRFVSDNSGLIAFDLPELMGRETWFDVIGHGYERPKDGFGYRGVRLRPEPGKSLKVEVNRTMIARRLGRVTGGGLFAESQKLGIDLDWRESGVLGCDSVQNTVHRGKLFWLWGDTTLAHYPLGVFDASSATSAVQPLNSFQPPLRLTLDYFRDSAGRPRGVAKMPGEGPTWLTAYVSLPDSAGNYHLVASYAKIRPPLEAYECGLCAWNDEEQRFEKLKTIWTKSASAPKAPPLPAGHPAFFKDTKGKQWVLFGNPLPTIRCPASFEDFQNPVSWEVLQPQESLASAQGGGGGGLSPAASPGANSTNRVKPHSGSFAWNGYRKRWVTIFVEAFGKPSAFGEVWYAEADSPTGPWSQAVKIVSHENYTFYNPRIHPEFTAENSPILIFEGTYTADFADRPAKTPRYDYNQILYRLDLDDLALRPAASAGRAGGPSRAGSP